MRTKQQYMDDLKKMRPNLYFQGERVGRDHEVLQQSIGVIGHTFDAAADPETAELCTTTSHLTGKPINRFCHVHQTPDDLHRKQDMTRALCRQVGYCIGRCMGIDAVNALNAVSYEADKVAEGKTRYHENYLAWLKRFQEKDLVAACAQTDNSVLSSTQGHNRVAGLLKSLQSVRCRSIDSIPGAYPHRPGAVSDNIVHRTGIGPAHKLCPALHVPIKPVRAGSGSNPNVLEAIDCNRTHIVACTIGANCISLMILLNKGRIGYAVSKTSGRRQAKA